MEQLRRHDVPRGLPQVWETDYDPEPNCFRLSQFSQEDFTCG